MNKKFHRTTKRLIIRPLKASDYLAWKSAYSNMLPQKNKWDQSLNRDENSLTKLKFNQLLKDHVQRRRSEEFCDYAIFLKSTGQFIGRVSLMNFVRSVTQSSFLGYALFNPYWGKGYAKEAVEALIDIAFKDHKLHRVVAGIEPKNKRSIKLVQKLGFRREGISKRVVLLRNKWQDLVQYALTTEDRKIKWDGEVQMRKK